MSCHRITVQETTMTTQTVVVLGAAGASGRRIARQLAAHDIPLTLAGRRPEPLTRLGAELGAATAVVDLADVGPVVRDALLVVNAVGPFTSLAPPIVRACLAAAVPYLDIANELPATQHVLGLHERAVDAGVALVTGAGFGPAVTESLLLRLLPRLDGPPAAVRVGAVPTAEALSDGVRATVAEAMALGAAWYSGGVLERAAFG